MAAYQGPIMDVDVHHRPKSDAEIVAYLPKQWQDYVHANGGRERLPLMSPPGADAAAIPYDSRRGDAFPGDGTMAGSSYEMLRDQLLDRYTYSRCLLVHDVGQFGVHLNPYYAAALCRAANDWNIETWMTFDKRLDSVVVVPLANPDEAAAEIRRVGRHERMRGVLVAGNPVGRPLGDPLFHPVWEAAAEMGLAVTDHVIRADRPGPQMGSVGAPKSRIEGAVGISQQVMHYISSFIVHGVFEKFPTLRVLITEFGVDWLPYVMWRLDQNYDLLRHESPWVKKWPSEYIHEHIKLSTQPFVESPDDKGATAELLSTVDGMENLLCFSSDYPHYSMDDPMYVARLIPESWHKKVFYENACAVYGWSADDSARAGVVMAGR